MIEFSENIANNEQLVLRSTNALTQLLRREFDITNVAARRRIYAFSAHANRGSEVYLSGTIPMVNEFAEFLSTEYDMEVAVGEFELAQENWVALRRDFHSNNPSWASEVLLVCWLQVNGLINW